VAVSAAQASSGLAYRANYLAGALAMVVQIYLLRMLWTAVYQGREAVDGISLAVMVSYATFANLQSWLVPPWEPSLIPARVRQGQVGTDLAKPMGFIAQMHARQLGRTATIAPFAVLTLPLAVLIGRGHPPASPAAALGYLASVVIAYVMATLLSVLVGMASFWIMETTGLFVLYRIVSLFFSGGLIPLWFMPGALRVVAEAMPFQAITYLPLAIYFGRVSGAATLHALAVQTAWVVALALAGRLAWARAVRRVVVQGG
jgi:ABC-type uncharacterized transport system permease subunit